jgi:DNA-directed RNA polymerase
MDQITWEQEAYASGMDRFFDNERQDMWDGKTDSTRVGTSILQQRVIEVGDVLREQAAKPTTGRGGAYLNAMRRAATRWDGEALAQDYNILAYVGLLTLLQVSYARKDKDKFLTAVSVEIGRRLEYDQQLYLFQQQNPGFVAVIDASLAQQNVTSLSHKLKTYQKKWRDAEMEWESWGDVTRLQVGLRVVRAILTAMDDCFELTKKYNGKHQAYCVETTLALDDYIIDEMDLISKTMPIMQPCIEPPLDWQRVEGEVVGGFHTHPLRRKAPFIKTKGREHKEFVNAAFPYKHMTAVNHMQQTAWEVNPEVLALVRHSLNRNWQLDGMPRGEPFEIPPYPEGGTDEDIAYWLVDSKALHGKNRANGNAQIVLGQSLMMADRLADRPFWFVYTCDFRGRIYCTSTMLSPQGTDHIKAMLRFHEAKPLGERGTYWLAVHGANKFGYDKVSYEDRVQWVHDNKARIKQVAEHPHSSESRSFLADADKPFQFAAFCFEWVACGYGSNHKYESKLPIGLDGSCNGLQHYAALLRDPVSGKGVNLTPGDIPNDIYGDVADEFVRLLTARSREEDARWILSYNPNRKATKRPVMTLPYGATQQSCRAYLLDWLEDATGNKTNQRRALWPKAVYATPILWEAIGNVVVAAREGMDWLQRCSTMIGRTGKYARWASPAEFPVYQHYSTYGTVDVQTNLFGRMRLKMQGMTTGIDKVRARNGIAPNFVHALDASHMVMAVNEAASRGMANFSLIHDDFGVHAADTEEFSDVIRLTFVRMYYDRNWLMAWKKEMERLDEDLELPDPPEMGDLDVLQVLDSKYFFG